MKTLFFGILFIVAALLMPHATQAQSAIGQQWVCLERIWCTTPGSGCIDTKQAHRAKLSTKPQPKPLPNATTYIFECLSSGNKMTCTTGSQALDTEALCPAANQTGQLCTSNALSTLQNDPDLNYRFEGIYKTDGSAASAKTTSDGAGNIGPFEWQSATKKDADRIFMALNNYIPSRSTQGNSPTQIQGTFDFETSSKNCIAIHWDPYGKVFDSKSLEPVPNASVTLKYATGGQMVNDIPGITNPQTTQESGSFSFVVPDNIYKLTAAQSEYRFPSSATPSANVTHIYSDLYRGEDIVQAGKIQHRDIPLDPLNGVGRTYPAKVDWFQRLDRATGDIIIDGLASHPFVKVTASSKLIDRGTLGRPLQTVQADKNGKFQMSIPQDKFTQNEIFGFVTWEKADLTVTTTSQNILQKAQTVIAGFFNWLTVQAQETTTVAAEPMPNYIEGYAYDASGKTIPQATVGVYLTFSNAPYYETKADSTGYFTITSEHLPFFPFTLRYESATGFRTSVTPSKFIAQNAETIAAKHIQLYAFKDSQGRNASQSAAATRPSGSPVASPATSAPVKPAATSGQTATLLLMVIILVFLGVAGILLGVYLYFKNRINTPTQPLQ